MDTRFIEPDSNPSVNGRSLDATLVERFGGRDEAAMAEMFNLYHKKIFLVAVRIGIMAADPIDRFTGGKETSSAKYERIVDLTISRYIKTRSKTRR